MGVSSKIIFLLSTLTSVTAYNILVYNPSFAQSHTRFLGNIADILARRGHNVTVLSPIVDPLLKPLGITEKTNIHPILYDLNNDPKVFQVVHDQIANMWTSEESNAITAESCRDFLYPLLDGIQKMCKDEDFIRKLKATKFDIAIHEFYETFSSSFMKHLGIKNTIAVSALGDHSYYFKLSGLINYISFIPLWITTMSDKMSFLERLQNFEFNIHLNRVLTEFENMGDSYFKTIAPELTPGKEIQKNQVGIIFSNMNEFTQTPRPTSNMIQYVGGSHVYDTKPLKQELDILLNKRKNNVMFSLGTYVRVCDIPHNIKKDIFDSFSSFNDTTFLIKYNDCKNETIDFSAYPNIFRSNWLPQSDLLGDDRINLFITHGGMNSIIEGQIRGKPMITIPIFADQVVNSQNAFKLGSTILITCAELNRTIITDSLKAMLAPNNKYIKEAAFVSKMLEGRPEEYRQKIGRWVELLIENGKPFVHLPLHSRNMSFITLFGLDILAFLLTSVILFSIVAYVVVKKLFSYVLTVKSVKKIQ